MKKFLLVVVGLFFVFSLSGRSKLEFSPKLTVYLDGGQSFGIGADLTVNPKKWFGLRMNLAEFLLGDLEGFSLNISNEINRTTFDFLYYTNLTIISYLDFTFGFLSLEHSDFFAIGFGLGLEKYMGKGNYLFFEPGISYLDIGDGEVVFRLPIGFKMGI
ncbi:MAG: hypothetical protein ABIN61_04450 [candidate division WOR-3 bacterium]